MAGCGISDVMENRELGRKSWVGRSGYVAEEGGCCISSSIVGPPQPAAAIQHPASSIQHPGFSSRTDDGCGKRGGVGGQRDRGKEAKRQREKEEKRKRK